MYDTALKAGAYGGKLLGAGSGGFILLYVDDEHKESVRKALIDYMEVPIRFENGGTRVLYYSPEEYIPKKKYNI